MPTQRSFQISNGQARIDFSRPPPQTNKQRLYAGLGLPGEFGDQSSVRSIHLNSNGQPKVTFSRPGPNRTMHSQSMPHNPSGSHLNQTKQNSTSMGNKPMMNGNGNGGAIKKSQTVQHSKAVTKTETSVNPEKFPKTTKSMDRVAQELYELIGQRGNGVWSTQLDVEYKRKFKEELPDNW